MTETVTDDAGLVDGDVDLEAEDPSDTIQRARIQSVLEARRRVLEKKAEARDFVEFHEINQEGKDRIIRDAVEDYIRELRWVMESTETETDYLNSIELGTVQLGSTTYEFAGVLDLLYAPKPLRDTWRETQFDEYEGRQTVNRTETKPVPERVVMNAFDACNKFCEEVGLDIRLERATEPIFGFEEVEK